MYEIQSKKFHHQYICNKRKSKHFANQLCGNSNHVTGNINNKFIDINTRQLPLTLRTEVKEDFKETRYRQNNHSLIKFSYNKP